MATQNPIVECPYDGEVVDISPTISICNRIFNSIPKLTPEQMQLIGTVIIPAVIIVTGGQFAKINMGSTLGAASGVTVAAINSIVGQFILKVVAEDLEIDPELIPQITVRKTLKNAIVGVIPGAITGSVAEAIITTVGANETTAKIAAIVAATLGIMSLLELTLTAKALRKAEPKGPVFAIYTVGAAALAGTVAGAATGTITALNITENLGAIMAVSAVVIAEIGMLLGALKVSKP